MLWLIQIQIHQTLLCGEENLKFKLYFRLLARGLQFQKRRTDSEEVTLNCEWNNYFDLQLFKETIDF